MGPGQAVEVGPALPVRITADLYTSVDELKQAAANAIADTFTRPDRSRSG